MIRMNAKEERKNLILGYVVHGYVSAGMPVSSKAVASSMSGKVSSATIRNTMAELEEEGLIEQPHTSAGRIPTQSGYRCYVDMIQEKIRVEKREARRLAAEYTRRINTIREVIEKTSFLISRELHNAGMVMWPSVENFYLKHLELVKVRSETVLAVLVTVTNAVRNYVVKLDRDLKTTELAKVANYINDNYESSPISAICEDLRDSLKSVDGREKGGVVDTARVSLDIVDAIVAENIENDIYLDGLDYFMERPDERDPLITRQILRAFSKKSELTRMMKNEMPDRGLRVYIGRENNREMMSACSLITCGYTMHGRPAGRIGVMGSMRMDYDSAMRTVSCLADLISAKLMEINR